MISNFSFLENNSSQYLTYISLPEGLEQPQLRTDTPLPVLLKNEKTDTADIVFNWDDVLQAILHIFLWQPQHQDIAYYQELVELIQPELSYHLLQIQRQSRSQMHWEEAEQLLLILNTLHNAPLWVKMELGFLYEKALTHSNYRQDSEKCQYWGNALSLLYNEVEQNQELDSKACYQLFFYYLSQQKYDQLYKLLQQQQLLLTSNDEESVDEDTLLRLKTEECEKLLQQLQCFAKDEPAYKALVKHVAKEHKAAQQLLLLEEQNNPFIAFLLALQYFELCDYEEAYTLFKRLSPQFDFLGVKRRLALCAEALGNHKEAVSLWKKLLQKETENLEAMQHLAELAEKQGDVAEAQAYWRTVACFDPHFPGLSEDVLQGSASL